MSTSPRHDTATWYGFSMSVLTTAIEIVSVWTSAVRRYSVGVSTEQHLIDNLKLATNYEDWLETAKALDDLPAAYEWRVNPVDSHYDYKHLDVQLKALRKWRREDNMIKLTTNLRHGLMRNMYGITNLSLYTKTYATTKESIHQYVDLVVESIKAIANSPTALASRAGRFTAQDKQNNLHGMRHSYGRTALILQGGSIFGVCHLGVVKALDEQDVLPDVIVGTATGALMAALVGIHTREDLPRFLCGDRIDLSAFASSSQSARRRFEDEAWYLEQRPPAEKFHNWRRVLFRRLQRLMTYGFVLDPDVLAQSVRDNVGDLTFDEAYKRTGRVLNIVVSSSTEEVPNLMNYLTAPNVLIRSAAMASHVTNMNRTHLHSLQLLRKDSSGQIEAFDIPLSSKSTVKRPLASADQNNPVRRLRQQFDIEHFIISQARPYIAPFAQPSLPFIRGTGQDRRYLTRMAASWIKWTLSTIDWVGLLPDNIRRILSDEAIPTGESITLVPDIDFKDLTRLLKNPTKDDVDMWILKGERSVWPSLCALKVRMAVEVALDECWESTKHRDRQMAGGSPTAATSFAPASRTLQTSAGTFENLASEHDSGGEGRTDTQRAEDRLLRDMQTGVGGFLPGITGMDDPSSLPGYHPPKSSTADGGEMDGGGERDSETDSEALRLRQRKVPQTPNE